MNEGVILLSGLVLGIWVYLVLFHGRYWRERPAKAPTDGPKHWPEVAAIIPARNEALVVGEALSSLLRQEYPGKLRIILVDDQSSDGTADIVRATAAELGAADRVRVISGKPLPEGWTGKMWAVHQGASELEDFSPGAKYVWLTDADIAHDAGSLRGLVARAEAGNLALTSLMARLKTDTFAECALIPAYVYFFQMLYPFAWVNDAKKKMAGAAGGCMLVQRKALKAAGGIAAIRNALIDDCALGKVLKKHGPIWLGLADGVRSLRGYPAWGDIWRLIARSAFTQLQHSLLLLAVCVFGMALTFLAPPLLSIQPDVGARAFGLAAWALMALSYLQTLVYYRQPIWWAPLLPLTALFYLAATIDSARRHLIGRGGEWKGRVQAQKPV
ncbi:glycosyltransferase [Dongia deserti]|uniref:glycosyltransferase n=1 Tax=Dongia deserti TaxID=2268030 RepID=UPI000E648F7A|nr:glycosyltransferase [Dongia deserti]